MNFDFLLHFLLPVVALLAGTVQSVAHAWIAAKHQPDHPMVIDKIVNGVVAVLRAVPQPQDQAPSGAAATP